MVVNQSLNYRKIKPVMYYVMKICTNYTYIVAMVSMIYMAIYVSIILPIYDDNILHSWDLVDWGRSEFEINGFGLSENYGEWMGHYNLSISIQD